MLTVTKKLDLENTEGIYRLANAMYEQDPDEIQRQFENWVNTIEENESSYEAACAEYERQAESYNVYLESQLEFEFRYEDE